MPTRRRIRRGRPELAVAYLKAAEELRREFSLKTEPDLVALLRLPGVIAPSGLVAEEERVALGAHLVACVEQALARLEGKRQVEGRLRVGAVHGRVAVGL